MAFKSNDRTFEKVYSIFDKRDYFNAKGLAKTQIGNFERALQRNDKGAQQILDKFKGDMGKAKDYITQVITDRKKEQAFNDYKAFKVAVDSIQKGKPQYGAVDLVKSRIHNSSQKYTIALYSALRNKKFTKWKDIHNDVDSLIGESVNEIDTKKANLLRTNMPGYVGPKFAKKASDEDILAMADLKDQKARIYNRYVKVVDDAIAKLQKKYKIKESVNEAKAFVVMYKVKKDLPNRNVKPSSAAYSKEADAKKFLKSIEKDGGKGMIVKSNVRGMKEDSKDGVPQGYNPTVENKKEVEQIANKTKSETAFYDVLSKIEKKYGKRNYRIWLEKSLKDLGVNAKHYDYRTNAAAEEKLYQLTK